MDKAMTAKIGRAIAAILITVAGVAVIAAIGSRTTANDYIEYWSAGKLFVQGANPYASNAILALEKSQGFTLDSPLIMLNPPWALPLVAWLGVCGERVGLVLWILVSAGCFAASVFLLEVPAKYRTVAFLFAPVIATFSMMQSSPFLLLGLALFLRFHRSRPFAAGAALALLSIKPHLFLIFWIVLLAESLYRRRFATLLGLAATITASSALVTLRAPGVWKGYLALIRGAQLSNNYFPTLPTLLRVTIHVQWTWLALVPSAVAAVWGLTYYWRNRASWSWRRHGMLVMLVTVLTSPYGWLPDQVVLLPALNAALSGRSRRFAMESLTALNTLGLVLLCAGSPACMWLPLGWLVWYLYANAGASASHESKDAARRMGGTATGRTALNTAD